MTQIKKDTSIIDLYRNGLVSARTMNSCRRKDITTVNDILEIAEKYEGNLKAKFGPLRYTEELQNILLMAA